MRSAKSGKPFSFLLEFLLVVLFFALASMVCMQLFAGSIRLHKEDALRQRALEYAQDFIEEARFGDARVFYLNERFEDEETGIYRAELLKDAKGPGCWVLSLAHEDSVLVELSFYRKEKGQ